ncbi:TonB-dependent receptor plug domain-containing protein [Flavobacterium foetidum]|uniref:TonB-dependent receptor plug domain-containing protein n=1 Tax=Flavobacterium foetidum TaxID=2026681 RepID=UPI001074E022|nr:TonB-dependent receptor plug domain-containing protein [Flavobacterium foetidum]KAF2517369.1 TonB-dependent receptor plug domain-containing protein [Flavobacterium foetidum]
MKNFKLVISLFTMLICTIITAQAKPISDTISHNKENCKAKTTIFRKEPLYILDGVSVNAAEFSKINPNDIESLKVLKGKEAVAFYGTKGEDGAIIVTTRKIKDVLEP